MEKSDGHLGKPSTLFSGNGFLLHQLVYYTLFLD